MKRLTFSEKDAFVLRYSVRDSINEWKNQVAIDSDISDVAHVQLAKLYKISSRIDKFLIRCGYNFSHEEKTDEV